jgi:farnesyl diphosphate synthase
MGAILGGARLDQMVNEAQVYLRTFGPRADGLRATASYFASRES